VSASEESVGEDVGAVPVDVGVSSSSEEVVSWARAGERKRSRPKRKEVSVSSCIVAGRSKVRVGY
jgi:hypothetical protein